MMKRRGDWVLLEQIGAGGQGQVFRARKFPVSVSSDIEDCLREAVVTALPGQDCRSTGQVILHQIFRTYDTLAASEIGAFKVLLDPEQAKNSTTRESRFLKELKALQSVSDLALIRLLDYNEREHWLVMEYHGQGTLEKHLGRFAGDLHAALSAFRPLVVALAKLHESGFIHRDIKPANIFIADNDRLVLGDFGLAYDDHPDSTRVTEPAENVGSWQWMPTWSQGEYIEEPPPSFDVFCLGKVLWAMVSGKNRLRLHYFTEPDYNLEHQFPDKPEMQLVNEFLGKCVVEQRDDGVQDAEALLIEVDALKRNALGGHLLPLYTSRAIDIFPDTWELQFRPQGGRITRDLFRIDAQGVYYVNDNPVFNTRIIETRGDYQVVFEKTRVNGVERFTETLRLESPTVRSGLDQRGHRVRYRKFEI